MFRVNQDSLGLLNFELLNLFGVGNERMETNGAGKKVKKERNVEIFFKNCVYTVNRQTNKH